jgi:hypothetical protein
MLFKNTFGFFLYFSPSTLSCSMNELHDIIQLAYEHIHPGIMVG